MTLGAGPEGSPDNQKVVNWDGPQLGEVNTTNETAQTIGPVSVGRYGYLNLVASSNLFPSLVTVEWSQTKASMPKLPTESRWRRVFVIDQTAVELAAILRIPNLGAWVRVRMAPVGGAAAQFMTVGTTNRVAAWESIPRVPVLVNNSHVFAGAGAFTVASTAYWGGPAQLLIKPSAAVTCFVDIEAAVEPNVWVKIDQVLANGGATVSQRIVLPLTAVRFQITANAAVTTTVAVTPYLTGSS